MSHRPAKIRPPLCEYPVGLRPPGYSQSGISNTLHMYSINVLIYANDNKFNCKKLFVKNRKILIDIHNNTKIPLSSLHCEEYLICHIVLSIFPVNEK